MAFCMNCGFQLPANAKFCFECGAKQEIIGNNQPANEEKPFVAVFDNEELSGYYEEEDGVDLTTAYEQEDTSPTEFSPNKKREIQKQSPITQGNSTVTSIPEAEDTEEDVEEDAEDAEENIFEPVVKQSQKTEIKASQPFNEEHIKESEDELFEEDEIDEYNAIEPEEEKADLSKLSSFVQEDKSSAERQPFGFNSKTIKPVTDPYWDDVKPEIDNEIYKIDRSIIFKGLGAVVALFAVITYLIYTI